MSLSTESRSKFPPPTFYRRVLPSTCVAFESERGKTLFKRALSQGNANIYFRLAAQFITQDEPAYCGLSTLVMVLNALEVDPGQIWKGPWRWYHESMLECCAPLEEVKKHGTTLRRFACLAACNRLDVNTVYSDTQQDDITGFNAFKSAVLNAVQSDDLVLVISYNRKVLSQTGTGHFSPVAAYDSESDMALIMDVARFKYPPHWTTLSTIWEAMKSVDPTTGRSRGYVSLRIRTDMQPQVLLHVPYALMQCDHPLWMSVIEWCTWLDSDHSSISVDHQSDQITALVVSECARIFATKFLAVEENVVQICDSKCKCKCNIPAETGSMRLIEQECCKTIFCDIQQTSIYAAVTELSSSLELNKQHVVSLVALILAWPYANKQTGLRQALALIVQNILAGVSDETRNEIEQLKLQLHVVLVNRCHSTDCVVKTVNEKV